MSKLTDEERRERRAARYRERMFSDAVYRDREAAKIRGNRVTLSGEQRPRKSIGSRVGDRVYRMRRMKEEGTENYRAQEAILERARHASNPERRKWLAEYNRKARIMGDVSSNSLPRKRTPPWVSEEERRQLRSMMRDRPRPDGLELDHIVPLKGDLISGLHVLANVQFLTHADHRHKTNAQRPYTYAEAAELVAKGMAVWRSDIDVETGEIDWSKYQPSAG